MLLVERDVTERRLARQRLELMDEAARIGSTLDVTRTAEEFVDVTVPRLADYVLVDLLDSVLRGGEPTPGRSPRHRPAPADRLWTSPTGQPGGRDQAGTGNLLR